MTKTFTYTKSSVLCAFSLPLFTLAVILILNMFIVIGLIREHYFGFGLFSVFAVLFVFSCAVSLKITDIIKTTITLDAQGITYHSILKKMVIPWQDIAQIKRVDLTTHGDVPTPQCLRDFKIQTRNHGGIYVFHFIHFAGQDNDAIDQFISEVITNTQLKLSGLSPQQVEYGN